MTQFKTDTTIVIDTNSGEVTIEGQRIDYGLVMHRTLNNSIGYTITDPVSSGIVTEGDTPAEALRNLKDVVEANGGAHFLEKLEYARDMHNRRKSAIEAAIELLRPMVSEEHAVYVLNAIAHALFPNVKVGEVRVPMKTSTTRH